VPAKNHAFFDDAMPLIFFWNWLGFLVHLTITVQITAATFVEAA